MSATRWVGPIPTIFIEKGPGKPGDTFYHPGGPAPKWGGYSPVRTDLDWAKFCELALAGKTAQLWDDQWSAHTAETRLKFSPEGWYVECPADRLAMRCVYIAEAALRDGTSRDELLQLGITEEEIAKAEDEMRFDSVLRADHDALSSFPDGRYMTMGRPTVHYRGEDCPPGCPKVY